MSVACTIAVLTYRGDELLTDCLTALFQDPWPAETELLIVANGPTAQVTLPRWNPRFLRLPYNTGNVGGINACYREAQGDYVFMITDDVRVQEGCVKAMYACRGPKRVLHPALIQPDGEVDCFGLRVHWPGYGARIRALPAGHKFLLPIPAISTSCFLMERAWWEQLGGFTEGMGVGYEDVDFSLRTYRAGGSCYSVPWARATHLMGQTIQGVVKQPLSPYYRQARQQVIRKYYTGLARWSRLAAVNLLDGVASWIR